MLSALLAGVAHQERAVDRFCSVRAQHLRQQPVLVASDAERCYLQNAMLVYHIQVNSPSLRQIPHDLR
jgi:hypothetical protein